MIQASQPDLFDRPAVSIQFPPDTPALVRMIGEWIWLHCQGKVHAATSSEISGAVGMQGSDAPRSVRNLISCHLESFPFLLCGSPSIGFFIPTDPDELTHYDLALQDNIRANALRLSAFRRQAARHGFTRFASGSRVVYSR